MLTSGTSLDVVSKPSARFALARTSGSVLTLIVALTSALSPLGAIGFSRLLKFLSVRPEV
jgi:hypothetical protein